MLLSAKQLKKSYRGRAVVAGVNIQLAAGQVVGLLGPNGAGKTSTFYMLTGLVRPDSGQVFMGDEEVTQWPMHRRARAGLGYLPQEASIFRGLSVEENLLMVAQTLAIPKAQQEERVHKRLEALGLLRIAHSRAYELSGGERRRVEIARSLILEPHFMLLDEPFSGVDPISVQDVQALILKLKSEGIGILITDHNVRETLSIVDHAYLLYEGRVLFSGPAHTLIEDPSARKLYLGSAFKL